MIAVRLLIVVAVLLAMLFLPAGTWAFWEAWVYLIVLLVPALLVGAWLFRNDPALLERRMRMKEPEKQQRAIIGLAYPVFFAAFLLPGFDRRFEWSSVPVAVVLLADVLVFLGYGMFFLVMRTNPYASRVIEVAPEQTVVTTGPYAVVRHPMYLGAVLMYVLSPLALGSWWALIPGAMMIPVFVARILNEETVLRRDLAGYEDYARKTRYRLIPGVW